MLAGWFDGQEQDANENVEIHNCLRLYTGKDGHILMNNPEPASGERKITADHKGRTPIDIEIDVFFLRFQRTLEKN